MANVDRAALLAERSRRQRLAPSARVRDRSQMLAALRALGPLSPRAYTFPGTPPELLPRADFDDRSASEQLRRRGEIVKGRFVRGNVGYVARQDLALYAAAYRRDGPLSRPAQRLLDILTSEGRLPRSELKGLTGMPGRRLSAALQELQRAFAVIELQFETEWDNEWAPLAREFPQMDLEAVDRERAIDDVLLHYLESLAFASERELVDRSALPARSVRAACERLLDAGRVAELGVDGLGAVLLSPETLRGLPLADPAERCVAVLHPLDPFVIAQRTALRRRYGRGGVLAYVVVDGAFAGAALGRWGILPFDVDDIVLEEPHAADATRREAILAGVALLYPPPEQRVLRYLGEPLEQP